MEIKLLEESDLLTRVALVGRLDMPGTDEIELKFNAMIAPRGKNTIVDFSGVMFMSSMGLRMLLTMARILARNKVKMVLQAPQGIVLESLRHAGIDDLIPVAADEAAARALFQS